MNGIILTAFPPTHLMPYEDTDENQDVIIWSSKGCFWAVYKVWWLVRQNWYQLWRQLSCLCSCESWRNMSRSYKHYGRMFHNYPCIAWQIALEANSMFCDLLTKKKMFVKRCHVIQIFLLSLSEMNCFVTSSIALLSTLSKCPVITTMFVILKVLQGLKKKKKKIFLGSITWISQEIAILMSIISPLYKSM